ncbi:MAG: DUF501 domain-containing protein [Propionibacteriaceae bacterium]|jgi:hypothetical protein|nr:DUF501 domain-containing protein [Propionibacteriaceae bacterium]
MNVDEFTDADRQVVTQQLGREPRGVVGVGWRCPCGNPGVVTTAPALPDGTPFPTTYYLTCPRAAARCSTLEAGGLMREMTQRLGADADLSDLYRRAHEAYRRDRAEIAERLTVDDAPIAHVTAGGMPDRVKCLHALLAHALAAGPGVNPFGDEVAELIGPFWEDGPCVPREGESSKPG